jgi:hypothetical protein
MHKTRKNPGTIKDIKPATSTLLVEMLNPAEALGTKLALGEDATDVGAPQAYVVAVGPLLSKDCGIKIGDRVLLQGNYIPAPNFDNNTRRRGIVELHAIKAVLVEEDD